VGELSPTTCPGASLKLKVPLSPRSRENKYHPSPKICHSEERSDEEPAFLIHSRVPHVSPLKRGRTLLTTSPWKAVENSLQSLQVTPTRIADLLSPFLGAGELNDSLLDQLGAYLDLLLRWNARINLTAVREPEHIVTRHFGESLFAARCLFAANNSTSGAPSSSRSVRQGGAVPSTTSDTAPHLIDVGSGAGFPGLPIKIWAPHIRLTLIESNHKKVTFLREVARTITLTNVNVFPGRAEDYLAASSESAPSGPNQPSPSPDPRADMVTLRAVERFATILPTAATLVRPGGHLCLLIGKDQAPLATSLLPSVDWHQPTPIPLSDTRIALVGTLPSTEPK